MSIVRKKDEDLPQISDQRLSQLSTLAECEPDYSDALELDDRFWETASFHAAKDTKVLVALRLEPEVLAWFKFQGHGHTTRMAAILKRFYDHHQNAKT